MDLLQKQNEWALENSSHPYVTPQMQLDMWESHNPKRFQEIKKLVTNSINFNGGKNPPKIVGYDNGLTETMTLRKDLTINSTRPQRPTDFNHLADLVIKTKGVFDHAKAGHILNAIRKDGSSNVWDHWHTTLYAAVAGIENVKVDTYEHNDSDLEKCRMIEQELFHCKNGLAKPVGIAEEHEKSVERKRADIRDNVGPKINIDVELDNLMQKVNISPTGRDPNAKRIDGFLSLKNTYKKVRSHYQKDADKVLIKHINLIKTMWPNDKILAYFLEGYTDMRIRFERHPVLNGKITDELIVKFFENFKNNSSGNKQTNFTSAEDGSARNEKGRTTESISLRIIYHINNWWKNVENNRQGLVNQKQALSMYNDDLTDLFIKATIAGTKKKLDVECPNCQHEFKQTYEG